MNNVDFSVIVLGYEPDFQKLINTLNSIIKQIKVSFEIVICDDGSKELYHDKLCKWVENNTSVTVKYVFNKENRGTIRNYLSGIEVSQGKYIKPISPGDYLYSTDTLKTYKNAFESENADILFSDAIYYYGSSIKKKRQYPKTRLLFDTNKLKKLYLVYGFFFLGATICSKKEILVRYLNIVKDKVIFLEDYSMITLALLEDSIVYGIEKPCVWYEFGEGISTNSKGYLRIKNDTDQVERILIERFPGNKYVQDYTRFRSISSMRGIKKYFNYLIYFPEIYYYKLLSKTIYRQLSYNTTINAMLDMIKTEG